ncbi:hypothetical protein [Pseudomonas sp. efr-133-TYG-5]|jgi:hypothetical protein|uniref:hypothetical protein n=1 Tax=Pseudomonas sp. efr-133-TYG-5 TaxID=3040310 RepID=UPI0025545DEF|nr:hypothetical protein [Pseudomonas sp. efr-133-TYG-5]
MSIIYVQFTDEQQTAIQSTFSCPQDPVTWLRQGQVADTDSRYLAFLERCPGIGALPVAEQ